MKMYTRKCKVCGVPKEFIEKNFRVVSGYKIFTCRKCEIIKSSARAKLPEVIAKRKKAHVICNAKLKAQVFAHYSGRSQPECQCCCVSDVKFLTIDHINGGGTKHRQSLGRHTSGSYFYRWLRDQGFPPGYRVLCFNCNCGSNNNTTCPHQSLPKKALALIRKVNREVAAMIKAQTQAG